MKRTTTDVTQFMLQVGHGPTARIFGADGEWYAYGMVGPGRYAPKLWKTRGGAERAVGRMGRTDARAVELVRGVPAEHQFVAGKGHDSPSKAR